MITAESGINVVCGSKDMPHLKLGGSCLRSLDRLISWLLKNYFKKVLTKTLSGDIINNVAREMQM